MDYSNPNDPWMSTGYDPYKGMTTKERMKAGCLSIIFMLGSGLIVIVALALLCGCKSVEYVPVIEHHTDTLIQTKVQYDSIYVHDSTIVEKGDSIIKIEHWHTKYVLKEVHDTTYVAKTDSVPVPYPVKEYIEKPLSATQKRMMWIGIITLAVVIFAAWKLKRFLPMR